MNFISKVASNYLGSGIRVMFELANQYNDLVSLCIGEPNFETPDYLKESAKKAIDDGFTRYVSNADIPELRKVITDKYKWEPGYKCTAENVMVSVGGMEAILLSLISIVDPGDEVIVTNPCYPNYDSWS